MTQLSLQHLVKHYTSTARAAVDDVSLNVESGEFVALLGPSGCGKTTILRIIAGLLDATSGDTLFNGKSIASLPPEQRDAVMVFQQHLLFPHMTVGENVAFGQRMRKQDSASRQKDAARMLERVQLGGFENRKPSELSGGQQQRVALARALATKPRLLLLDEPLASLDATLREDMRELLRNIHNDLRITTILVTHDQEEAVTLAHRIALLNHGQLLQYGKPQDFYNAPANLQVARFFGGRNFLDGEWDGSNVVTPIGNLHVSAAPTRRSIVISIRPEHVVLGASPRNGFKAVLAEKVFLGTQFRLRFKIGAYMFEALASPLMANDLQLGSTIPVTFPPENLIVLQPD